DLGFRCCTGAASPATIPPIKSKPPFRAAELAPPDIAKIFAALPELAKIGPDIRYFDEDDVEQIIARGGNGKPPLEFATTPIFWSPEPGSEVLVLTGRSNKTSSFIAALYPMPDGSYRAA